MDPEYKCIILFLSIHPLQAVLWKEACPPWVLPCGVCRGTSPIPQARWLMQHHSFWTRPPVGATLSALAQLPRPRHLSRGGAPGPLPVPASPAATLRDEEFSGASRVPWASGRAEHLRQGGPSAERPGTGTGQRGGHEGSAGAALERSRLGRARGHGGGRGQHPVRLHPGAAAAGQGRDGERYRDSAGRAGGARGERPLPSPVVCRVF